MTKILVDGEPMEIKSQPLTVLCHRDPMEIEAPDHVKIGPEETIKVANEVEQDQWEFIRKNERFLACWEKAFPDHQPPEVISKSNLAMKHITGIILMMHQAQGEGKPVHLQYPESYLHPAQCARLMTLIYFIQGEK